ncbi:MAG TPA: M1 family metallopeptidase [Vicinamibacterales bacterium]|nr:M1 family metallopeptidase [Vicinamibacterales bacterium]
MRVLAALCAAIVFIASSASAQRLPAGVTPEHYDLAFVVDLQHERFDGTETIRVDVTAPTTRIVLNALDIEFREVTIGAGAAAQKATVTTDAAAQLATFTVPRQIPAGKTEIHVRYGGTLNSELRGFYISQTKARKYAVTQFESTDARRAFPCFDEPSFKATFALTVTIDRGDTAISNGKAVSDTPGPAPTQHTMVFSPTPKMSSYLVAIAVGDFKCLDGAADGVPIRICATPDKRDLGRIALDSAQQILKFYNGYYSIKYPFGKLDVVAVPDFAAGAMENTAAIFYRETDLLTETKTASVDARKRIAGVLAHEMAHQWFGDLVTMQWWEDIWLNEGFATWMANKPLAAAHADWNVDVDEAQESQQALTLDSLNATRPIHVDVQTPAQIDEAFDAITYQKGAAVLRMVESYVGAETFRKGVNAYLQAHAYGNATSEDFWKALSASSGKPVERILPTFVNQPGVPLISVSVSCAGGGTAIALRQERFFVDAAHNEPGRWQMPVCVKAPGQAAPACDVLNDASQTIAAPGACAPWVFANAGARGYYRTAYSSEMLRAMAPHVESDLTPAERLSLIDDEWALVRAGRHGAADYLTLATGYGREHVGGVLDDVVRGLSFVHEVLTAGESRTRFEAFARSLFQPLYEEVGFTAAAGDTDDRKALRATVIGALGGLGGDPDLAARARTAADSALGGTAPLDPTTAGVVLRLAAQRGDARLFDALVAAAERTSDPDEHYRYLYALTAFRDPALIRRGLELAVTPQLRTQDTAIYLAQFLANPDARDAALSFVADRWPALEPKVKVFGGDTTLVNATGSFCDAASRDRIKAFFAAHPLPAAVRTLQQSLERIDNCIALRDKQTSVVAAWLASR